MKNGLLPKCVIAAVLALLVSGCVVQRTVMNSNGERVSSSYGIKDPLSGTGN